MEASLEDVVNSETLVDNEFQVGMDKIDLSFTKLALRRNFDVISVQEGRLLFKSDNTTTRLESTDIHGFFTDVLPLLNGNYTLNQIYDKLHNYKREDIQKCIRLLEQSGLLEEREPTNRKNEKIMAHYPQVQMLKDIGVAHKIALKNLHDSCIAIFGLGAHGSFIANALANEGIGHIKLSDESLIREEDIYLSTIYKYQDIGKRKEDALIEHLKMHFACYF